MELKESQEKKGKLNNHDCTGVYIYGYWDELSSLGLERCFYAGLGPKPRPYGFVREPYNAILAQWPSFQRNKKGFSPLKEPSRKVIKGAPKAFGLYCVYIHSCCICPSAVAGGAIAVFAFAKPRQDE